MASDPGLTKQGAGLRTRGDPADLEADLQGEEPGEEVSSRLRMSTSRPFRPFIGNNILK